MPPGRQAAQRKLVRNQHILGLSEQRTVHKNLRNGINSAKAKEKIVLCLFGLKRGRVKEMRALQFLTAQNIVAVGKIFGQNARQGKIPFHAPRHNGRTNRQSFVYEICLGPGRKSFFIKGVMSHTVKAKPRDGLFFSHFRVSLSGRSLPTLYPVLARLARGRRVIYHLSLEIKDKY